MEGPIGIALFGLGRAGSIHIKNLRKNYRCELLYVVELDVNRALEVVEHFYMKDTRVVEPKNAEEVYKDPKWVVASFCSENMLDFSWNPV